MHNINLHNLTVHERYSKLLENKHKKLNCKKGTKLGKNIFHINLAIGTKIITLWNINDWNLVHMLFRLSWVRWKTKNILDNKKNITKYGFEVNFFTPLIYLCSSYTVMLNDLSHLKLNLLHTCLHPLLKMHLLFCWKTYNPLPVCLLCQHLLLIHSIQLMFRKLHTTNSHTMKLCLK